MRAELLRASAHTHFLILVLHHVAADEITWDLLFADLSGQYAFETGQSGSAPTAPDLEYADYAVWEQQRLRRGDLDGQLQYWVDRFTPAPPLLAFRLRRSLQGNAAQPVVGAACFAGCRCRRTARSC